MRHHLVVLHEPYLRLMLAGRKRVECRLSSVRRAPFEAVKAGDLLWFKLPSGPIAALGCAGQQKFRRIAAPTDLMSLVKQHGSLICAADGFFESAMDWARYASFIWIDWVAALRPMRVVKSDQRAWVILKEPPRPGMRIESVERPRAVAT